MAEIIQGLFGVSPETLKAQQEAQFQQQTLNLAQLGPEAQRFALMTSGGRALGQAVGGLFGAQDPAMYKAQQENTLIQETLSSLTPEQQQNPMAVHQAIFDMAQQRGLTDLANKSFANMQTGQMQQAKLNTEQAQAAKYKAEAAKAARIESDKRYLSVGKNIFDTSTSQWIPAPEGVKSDEDTLSTDKKISNLVSIYSNDQLPLDVRNKAATEANNLIPIIYKGEGNVPQLTTLTLQQGVTPNDSVARGDFPTGTVIASPQVAYKAMPGSKAEQKYNEGQVQALDSFTSRIEGLTDVRKSVKDALKLTSKDTTGWNAYGKYFPGSPAMALDGLIKNIKSRAALDTIQALKQESKTGATGFGALNLKELETIENAITVLSQTNDEKVVKNQLNLIDEYFNRVENKAKDSYKTATGQAWLPNDRRAAFKFPANYSPTPEQETQVIKAIKAIELGKMTREQALGLLKQSPYFKNTPVSVDAGGR